MKKTSAKKIFGVTLAVVVSCSAAFAPFTILPQELSPSLTVNAGSDLPFVPIDKEVKNKSYVSADKVQTGTRIVLTGAASGGTGKYTFSYYYKRQSSDNWIALAENTASLSAGVKPKNVDTYVFKVIAKDTQNHTGEKIMNVDVLPAVVNNSSVNSEKLSVGSRVYITGAAEGGSGDFTYSYYYKCKIGKKWVTLSENTTETTAVVTPGLTETYYFRTTVTDSNGFSSTKTMSVDMTDGHSDTLINNSIVATQDPKAGVRLYIKGVAEGGTGEYRYAFYYKRKIAKRWTRFGTEFGTADTASFKPTSPGEFEIKVDIMDEAGELSSKLLEVTVR